MVSDTGNDAFGRVGRSSSTRELGLEGLGVVSIVLGAAAVVVFFIPGFDELAWVPAVPALLLGALDLALGVNRRRYAIMGMMFAVVALSWSVAMVLFGSAR